MEVTVDPERRSVQITDNGTGVSAKEFVRRLTAFGASSKRGRPVRGFRGVGRLGGLGYCQELVFRSKARSDGQVSELRWDCRKLRQSLRASDDQERLHDVVAACVTHRVAPRTATAAHFFQVELLGIIRHRNDQLLDAAAIRDYLAQVAPVPFSPDFKVKAEIEAILREHVPESRLHIYINGSPTPIYRPYSDRLTESDGTITEVQAVKIPGVDGPLAAIGWVAHHGYAGALPASSLVRGVRLRVGDLQVGDNRLLEETFPEPRFNGWSVGEIHILDRRVVPNGRRDHFEQNTHYRNLVTHFTPVAREITRRCRSNSIQRNKWRGVLREIENARTKLEVVKQGVLGKIERKRVLREVHGAIGTAEKLLTSCSMVNPNEPLKPQRELKKLRKELGSVEGEPMSVGPLERLGKTQREAFQQVFELIYECAPNEAVAKSIVDRVLTRL